MRTKEEQIYWSELNKKVNQAEHLKDSEMDFNFDKLINIIEDSKELWKQEYPDGSRGENLKQNNQFIIEVQKELKAGKSKADLLIELHK